jgi:CRISPR-associated protein Cas2
MWMLVMFDLPVGTPEERHDATKFRNFLLDLGFERTQYSIYLRFCKGKEQVETYSRKVETAVPEYGSVNLLAFTDKQYENIVRFRGKTKEATRKNPDQLALF